MASLFQLVEQGVRFAVRVSPGASHSAIDGLATDKDNQPYIKVRVTAVPERGKANQALIKLLSKSMGLPKSSFSLVSCQTDRHKTLVVEGRSEDLMPLLEEWSKGI